MQRLMSVILSLLQTLPHQQQRHHQQQQHQAQPLCAVQQAFLEQVVLVLLTTPDLPAAVKVRLCQVLWAAKGLFLAVELTCMGSSAVQCLCLME